MPSKAKRASHREIASVKQNKAEQRVARECKCLRGCTSAGAASRATGASPVVGGGGVIGLVEGLYAAFCAATAALICEGVRTLLVVALPVVPVVAPVAGFWVAVAPANAANVF